MREVQSVAFPFLHSDPQYLHTTTIAVERRLPVPLAGERGSLSLVHQVSQEIWEAFQDLSLPLSPPQAWWVRPSGRNRGLPLRRRRGQGPHLAKRCSCLEKPRDGGAWWAAVYGVALSQTRLKQLSSSSIHMSPPS